MTPVVATVVLDIDGTLVDSNYHHTLAWFRAFGRFGLAPPLWRIHRAIGMGGDRLVAEVCGREAEARVGDDVRAAWSEEFEPMLSEVPALAGAHELLVAITGRGMDAVLASSGKREHVKHYLDLLDAREVVAGWTTAEDVEQTKPAPDLVAVALDKVRGDRAVVVGDSTWDCRAAARIGLPSVGVCTGGIAAQELREAGAAAVYATLWHLCYALDRLPLGVPELAGDPAGAQGSA